MSLTIEQGEIVGLMGDNGAGKSTLVKIIGGNHTPSGGDNLLEGRPVHLSDPAQARHEGVEVVYQDLALRDILSSSVNVFLGVIFGFSIKSSDFRVFRVSNSAATPASVGIEELPVGDSDLIILGDRKAAIRERVLSLRTRFEVGSANGRRAPITAPTAILREGETGSIGGYLQLCTAFRDDVRHLTITAPGEGRFPFVGFDLYRDIGHIGGFSPALSFGLSAPGPSAQSPAGQVP